MKNELWKRIPGYENYKVSSAGRVRNENRKHFMNGGILSTSMTRNGYYFVHLCKHGKQKNHRINRLVLAAFTKTRGIGLQASHINGNRKDNRLSNLSWLSCKENINQKRMHGTMLLGEKHHQAKLKNADIKYIRKNFVRWSRTKGKVALGKKFGVSSVMILNILKRRNWVHV